MMSTVLTVFFWVIAVMWFGKSLRTAWDILHHRRLPPLDPLLNDAASQPSVTVVVPARDEAARIERTVRQLLAQQAVHLELVVVDDRSTDGTQEILRRLASEDSRLKLIRVDQLPDGWIGKCHACHVGAAGASGDWLLFTDGDVWLSPDAIARAVAAAERENADHVCLTPGLNPTGILVQAGLLTFQIAMADHVARVNRDSPRGFIGIGAFNLLRAATYRSFGGHEPLRLEVLDDMKLGLLVRRAGGRTRCFIGQDDVQAEWATSLWGIVKALEKNAFAQLQFNVFVVLLLVVLILFCWGGAVIGPWTGSLAGIAAGVGLVSMIIPSAILAWRQRWPFISALLTPLACLILVVATVNSAVVTLRQGGIRWRDTFYPIAMLRAGRVR